MFFQLETSLGRCEQLSTFGFFFFFSFSEEQISYALNPCFKTKRPVRHSIIGLTKRA